VKLASGMSSLWLVALAASAAAQMQIRGAGRAGVEGREAGLIRGETTDPCLGQRWRLEEDPAHPAGPWRLVLIEGVGRRAEAREAIELIPERIRAGDPPKAWIAGGDSAAISPGSRIEGRPQATRPLPAPRTGSDIHAGDRIVVEQRTAILEAQFEAVALDSASAGDRLRVRLSSERNSPGSLSGRVIEVVVTGRGRASWATASTQKSPEVQP
jgi:hypothetical protein